MQRPNNQLAANELDKNIEQALSLLEQKKSENASRALSNKIILQTYLFSPEEKKENEQKLNYGLYLAGLLAERSLGPESFIPMAQALWMPEDKNAAKKKEDSKSAKDKEAFLTLTSNWAAEIIKEDLKKLDKDLEDVYHGSRKLNAAEEAKSDSIESAMKRLYAISDLRVKEFREKANRIWPLMNSPQRQHKETQQSILVAMQTVECLTRSNCALAKLTLGDYSTTTAHDEKYPRDVRKLYQDAALDHYVEAIAAITADNPSEAKQVVEELVDRSRLLTARERNDVIFPILVQRLEDLKVLSKLVGPET